MGKLKEIYIETIYYETQEQDALLDIDYQYQEWLVLHQNSNNDKLLEE